MLRLTARELAPRPAVWGRIAAIGFPASGEFIVMFGYVSLVYWVIRDAGSEAQAGFGIGMRVMQSIFLPAMAIAFAAGPIAGQNFGAGDAHRVRATFRQAALIGSGLMFVLTLLCHVAPQVLVSPFTDDPAVAAVAIEYLQIISWNFVAVGLVFACSGLFQALGDTRPAFFSSLARFVSFAIPAVWLSQQPDLDLRHVWYASVASVLLQMTLSLWLLRGQFRDKLGPLAARPAPGPAAAN
jgi:Na+-driven multidrug efflux pump